MGAVRFLPCSPGEIIFKMKCELQISRWCKKRFRKDKGKIIDGKECCGVCFWLQKQKNKQKLISNAKNIIARNKNKTKHLNTTLPSK